MAGWPIDNEIFFCFQEGLPLKYAFLKEFSFCSAWRMNFDPVLHGPIDTTRHG